MIHAHMFSGTLSTTRSENFGTMVLHTPCFMQSELMHEIGRVAILPMDRCELTPASFQVEVRGSLANVGPRLAWHSMWWLI